jgi:hypothetical protein
MTARLGFLFIGAIAAIPLMVACAANANMRFSTNGNSEANASASTDDNSKSFSGAPTASSSAPATTTTAVTAAAPANAPTGCPLVCFNANATRARLGADDEARLTSSLAGETQTLRSCTRGGALPSLTLRFDSTSTLTEFGVDDERSSSDSGCVDGVRSHKPAVTFPGPATVRCSEHCGGNLPTRAR